MLYKIIWGNGQADIFTSINAALRAYAGSSDEMREARQAIRQEGYEISADDAAFGLDNGCTFFSPYAERMARRQLKRSE